MKRSVVILLLSVATTAQAQIAANGLILDLDADKGVEVEDGDFIVQLTIATWNKSMFPADRQAAMEKDIIDTLVPRDGDAEQVGTIIQAMEIVDDRRKKLFPNLRRYVLDCMVPHSLAQHSPRRRPPARPPARPAPKCPRLARGINGSCVAADEWPASGPDLR